MTTKAPSAGVHTSERLTTAALTRIEISQNQARGDITRMLLVLARLDGGI